MRPVGRRASATTVQCQGSVTDELMCVQGGAPLRRDGGRSERLSHESSLLTQKAIGCRDDGAVGEGAGVKGAQRRRKRSRDVLTIGGGSVAVGASCGPDLETSQVLRPLHC